MSEGRQKMSKRRGFVGGRWRGRAGRGVSGGGQ